MLFSIFLARRQPNGKIGPLLPPAGGSNGRAGVIVQPSDFVSSQPSQIRPRFCVPNSNRCQSGPVSAGSARIRKNEGFSLDEAHPGTAPVWEFRLQ